MPAGLGAITLVDLNDIVTKVVNLIRDLLTGEIRLRLRLESSLRPIEADPLGLEQVLVNLILNAKQAMPEGGLIALETASVELVKKLSRNGGQVPPGRYTRLTVEDSGCGMTPAVVARVFATSSTTRPAGPGVGLGLSSCLRIVRDHGGAMTIDSDPGRGTRVAIYLPSRFPLELSRPPDRPRASTPV